MLRDYFNERAGDWDSTAAEKDTTKLAALADRIGLQPGQTVLDVGTGTGVFLPYILQKIGASGFVYALDIAEKMLEKAAQKNPQKNIRFICDSVEEIPLEDETCDVAICYSSFPHFSDKPKAIKEMKRVLNKDGLLFIVHSSSREHINEVHRKIEAAKHDLLPDAVEMKRLLDAAGLADIKVEDKAESYLATGKKS